MECEKCGESHVGDYGSGRFCSSSCARSFSTASATDINRKRSLAMKGKKTGRNTNSWTQESKDKHRESFYSKYESVPFDDLSFDKKRERVIREQGGCCNRCGIFEWMSQPISLELEHKNGNNKDNLRENLEGLCPNCHSLTPTWRGRNKTKISVSDDELSEALTKTKSIRQALIMVGLSPKGNNYVRAKRIRDGSSVG